MRALATLTLLVAIGATLVSVRRSDALSEHVTVRSPRDCPKGLTVKSTAGERGAVVFDVSVEPETIAHAGDLYKGRVKSHAILAVSRAEEELATVTVHGTIEGTRTRYQFRLSPSAARSSQLQIGVSLYEKDGHPTLGGAVSIQVHLGGFSPSRPADGVRSK